MLKFIIQFTSFYFSFIFIAIVVIVEFFICLNLWVFQKCHDPRECIVKCATVLGECGRQRVRHLVLLVRECLAVYFPEHDVRRDLLDEHVRGLLVHDDHVVGLDAPDLGLGEEERAARLCADVLALALGPFPQLDVGAHGDDLLCAGVVFSEDLQVFFVDVYS